MDNAMPSLADIAAVTRNDEYGYGGGWMWIIVLFLIMFAGGGMWGNRGCNSDVATKDDVANAVYQQTNDGMLRQLTYGLADSTYALNNAIGAVGTQALENKYDIGSKIDNCCCTTQRAIDGVNYNTAIAVAGINQNIDAKFAALEKAQLEQRIADQNSQIQQLRLEQQMCGVVRYPNGFVYNAGQSPFCGCGCGCNI